MQSAQNHSSDPWAAWRRYQQCHVAVMEQNLGQIHAYVFAVAVSAAAAAAAPEHNRSWSTATAATV